MNLQFYYVVNPQLEDVNGFQESNDLKDITVYQMVDNKPEIYLELERDMQANSEEEIVDEIMESIRINLTLL